MAAGACRRIIIVESNTGLNRTNMRKSPEGRPPGLDLFQRTASLFFDPDIDPGADAGADLDLAFRSFLPYTNTLIKLIFSGGFKYLVYSAAGRLSGYFYKTTKVDHFFHGYPFMLHAFFG